MLHRIGQGPRWERDFQRTSEAQEWRKAIWEWCSWTKPEMKGCPIIQTGKILKQNSWAEPETIDCPIIQTGKKILVLNYEIET